MWNDIFTGCSRGVGTGQFCLKGFKAGVEWKDDGGEDMNRRRRPNVLVVSTFVYDGWMRGFSSVSVKLKETEEWDQVKWVRRRPSRGLSHSGWCRLENWTKWWACLPPGASSAAGGERVVGLTASSNEHRAVSRVSLPWSKWMGKLGLYNHVALRQGPL